MLLARRCPSTASVARRPVALCRLAQSHGLSSSKERRDKPHSDGGADQKLPFLKVLPREHQEHHQRPPQEQQQQPLQQLRPEPRRQGQPPTTTPDSVNKVAGDNKVAAAAAAAARPSENENENENSNNRHGLAMLISAVREVSLARRDLGWGVDAVAMRLTMLGILRHGRRNKPGVGGIPQEATEISGGREWLDGRAAKWERFLRWAHASYGWTEEVVVQRAGFAPGEVEVVALTRGKSRNRPMAPTYVLAVDHGRREIVLSVRGTKAFGDAITITHFRPEPFLDGYAHRGFAQSAHELVKQVEPQLTSLVERLPEYRVCFTGHSMGGGIAAMASMLIRDSANRRHKQQHKRQKPRPPAAGSSSTSPPSAGAAATTTPPSNSDRISRSDDPGDPRGLTGPRAGDEARGAQAGGAGFGGGLGAGPMVYSFATPCCVSLELARGCEGWVDSIVHGDDAIPRLSTVSLELLKEDMTAAEWRRAVDRLTNLNTVLSPSTKAASAAAAAIKNALAGLGSLARREGGAGADAGGQGQPKASGNGTGGSNTSSAGGGGGNGGGGGGGIEFVSSREGWREDKKAPPGSGAGGTEAAEAAVAAAPPVPGTEPTARPATESFAATGTGEGAQSGLRSDGGGGGCEKEETDRKRDDLGRSVRDTALTMRGLAKLYPLSQSFRQEIASIVSQVVNLTGGEKGDGAGAISPPKPPALGTADHCGDDKIPNDDGQDQRSQVRRQGDGPGAGDGSGAAAAGEGMGAEVENSSRPELLLTLKENLENLGVNRAALKSDNLKGSGAAGSGSGSGGTDSVDAGDHSLEVPQRVPATAADAALGAASVAEGDATETLTAAAGRDAASVATAAKTESPGKEKKREKSTPERGTAATTARLGGTNPGCGGGDDDRLRFLHESYIARPEPSLLPLYPPGDSFLVCNNGSPRGDNAARRGEMGGGGGGGGGGHSIRAPVEQGGAWTGQSIGAAVSEAATSVPPSSSSSAAAATAADAPSSAQQAGGLANNTGGTATRAPRGVEGSTAVLVRVPHEHFLRMPLSPSMLEDHSMSSYQRALAGLFSPEKRPARV